MLGLDQIELIGRKISTFVDKADQQRWNRLKLKLLRTTSNLKAVIRLHLTHKLYAQFFVRNHWIKESQNQLKLVIIDITKQEQIANKNKALRVSEENLRIALSREMQIREDEQSRIGRDLHDQIGSDLAAIKSQILLALNDVKSGRSPDAHLVASLDITANVSKSIRSAIFRSHPPELDSLGIWIALKSYSNLVRDQHEIDCNCIIDPALESIDTSKEVSAMVFRVVQEAITNVIRHAHASKIIIEAHPNSKTLSLSIKDDGIGISSNLKRNRSSHGIIGMAERCRLYGGKFSIRGASGKGTEVTLSLPLKRKIES